MPAGRVERDLADCRRRRRTRLLMLRGETGPGPGGLARRIASEALYTGLRTPFSQSSVPSALLDRRSHELREHHTSSGDTIPNSEKLGAVRGGSLFLPSPYLHKHTLRCARSRTHADQRLLTLTVLTSRLLVPSLTVATIIVWPLFRATTWKASPLNPRVEGKLADELAGGDELDELACLVRRFFRRVHRVVVGCE